jgi:hypothetical protein
MERLAEVIFVIMIVLSPLGFLTSLYYRRMANKAVTGDDQSKTLQLQAQSQWKLVGSLVDAAVGVTGYAVVSRKLLPQIDSAWILMVLISISGAVNFFFIHRLKGIRKRA